MNIWGIAVGAFSFVLIGALHPVVIKSEYHIGTKCWPCFLLGGLASIAAAAVTANEYASVMLAVTGFALLWCIKELHEQSERVRKGWFPANPARTAAAGER